MNKGEAMKDIVMKRFKECLNEEGYTNSKGWNEGYSNSKGWKCMSLLSWEEMLVLCRSLR